jgi:hypothetical protein
MTIKQSQAVAVEPTRLAQALNPTRKSDLDLQQPSELT